ncbi:hypothetical protein LEMLEM_LOCUS25913 [Lemmus lemmus]
MPESLAKQHDYIQKWLYLNLYPAMDGDRDRDPHWSTGLSS